VAAADSIDPSRPPRIAIRTLSTTLMDSNSFVVWYVRPIPARATSKREPGEFLFPEPDAADVRR